MISVIHIFIFLFDNYIFFIVLALLEVTIFLGANFAARIVNRFLKPTIARDLPCFDFLYPNFKIFHVLSPYTKSNKIYFTESIIIMCLFNEFR